MSNRSYLNFDISIERAGEFYRARVLQSCAGEGSIEFELPFSEYELENFILKMGHARRSTRRKIRGSDSPEMAAAKQFGGKLFGAVFQGDVYACLRASLDEARSQDQGVRVLLRLAPDLADIPWEYIYNPAWNQFFALSTDTPLVRYLELTPPIFPLPVKPPLRLLVVISSPSEYPALDVEREWHNLQEALEPLVRQGLLEVERLESADLLALQRKLRRGEYHIFHFIGHGSFDESAQDGLLLFTDELGRGKPLSGQYLGTLLRDHHTLRLAVLNACEGARTGREDPFAGVAQSLVQMGLPAVIAMQFEISDSAAILFALEFYTALADGYPVDAALADARKAIFASSDCEWGTPVLFSRALDGRIFELTRPVTVPAATKAKKPVAHPVKVTRQIEDAEANRLFEDGLSAFYLEDWGQAQESFQAALKVQPDHPAASEKLALAQRQFELAQRYAQAQQQLAAQDWAGAQGTLEGLTADTPQYRDAEALLQTTRKRLRLAELYSDAARLSQAGQWTAVVSIFEQLRQLDPACPDPDGLLPAAKNALAVAERQEKLSELYRQALQALDAQDWRTARQRLEQVGRMQADYRDTARLLAKAKAEIARPSAEAERPAAARRPVKIDQPTEETIRPAGSAGIALHKLPRWLWLVGGIGLLGMIALGIWLAQSKVLFGGSRTPTTTPSVTTDAQGVQMALIPAGKFEMGSKSGTNGESPVHTVNLTEAFYMDIYEVTNAAYTECVTAGACSAPASNKAYTRSSWYDDPTYADYPLLDVLWSQADAYCAWRGGSLPTEAQWEYAARGGLEGKKYPWGNENPVCTPGAYNGANYGDCPDSPVSVGSYAPNGYGLYDMTGNVWEWVADWYQFDYYSTYPPDGWPDDPVGPDIGDYSRRVMRGGAGGYWEGGLRVADRSFGEATEADEFFGFRCVAQQQAAAAQTAEAIQQPSATQTPIDLWEIAATHTAVFQTQVAFASKLATALASTPTSLPTAITDAQDVRMVLIPAGTFQMGSESGDKDESPVHTVNLTEAFYMDVYEVTNAAYAACVEAGYCRPPVDYFTSNSNGSYSRSSYYDNPTFASFPVIFVSWDNAQDFCAWRGGSLPTEAQWEYAARGGLESQQYPWGNESPVCTSGVKNGAAYFGCVEDTVAEGSYAPNSYGLYDMAGNVWEWVADWFQSDYYSTYPIDGWPDNPLGPESANTRVVRGGGFLQLPQFLSVSLRIDNPQAFGNSALGFRCVLPVGE
jgi:formylglycine-generating enzyme required for sulfatase activity